MAMCRSMEKSMTASSSVEDRLMKAKSTRAASCEATCAFSQYPMIRKGSSSDMDQS